MQIGEFVIVSQVATSEHLIIDEVQSWAGLANTILVVLFNRRNRISQVSGQMHGDLLGKRPGGIIACALLRHLGIKN